MVERALEELLVEVLAQLTAHGLLHPAQLFLVTLRLVLQVPVDLCRQLRLRVDGIRSRWTKELVVYSPEAQVDGMGRSGLHVVHGPPEVEEVGVARALQEVLQLAPGDLVAKDVWERDLGQDVVPVGLDELGRSYVVLEVVPPYLPQPTLAGRLGSPQLGGVHT